MGYEGTIFSDKPICTNVKSGLVNPPLLINLGCPPPKKCSLKTGGPPGLINFLAWTWLIILQCWNRIFLSNSFYFQFFLFLIMSHQSQNSSLLYLRFKLKYGFVLFSNSLYFQMVSLCILKLKPHEHQNPSLLIIENLKNNYSPNDRFLIKFFIKIISLDSSQRVHPHEPMSPINNNQGLPLINQPPCP